MSRSEDPPSIGVVLPVFRVRDYVGTCVDSIAAQTVPPTQIVVVDDCGGDDSVDLAVAALERHGLAYELVTQPANGGLGRARNDGLARLTTDLVWFLDSDDTAEPTLLARLAAALEATGAQVATCRTRRVLDGETGTGVRADRIDEPPYTETSCTGVEFARGLLDGRFTAYAPTKLFRRSAVPARLWDEGRAYEDFAPMVRFGLSVDRVALINDPLYRYRWRPSSLSARFGPQTLDLFAVGEAVSASVRAAGLARSWRTSLIGYRYREVLLPVGHLAMRALDAGVNPAAAQALRQVRQRVRWSEVPRLAAGRAARPLAFAVLVKLAPALYRAVLRRR